MNNDTDSYILATGIEGSKRLEIQNRIHFNNSCTQLKQAGLSKNQTVYEIGCGTGVMTERLSREVGQDGKIFAMDISQAQLAVASHRISANNLNNVAFILGDITKYDSLNKDKADLVYSRFVLMHLQNPRLAIENLRDLLKSGGALVLQEPIWSKNYVSLHREIFDAYSNAAIALGKSRELEFNLGEHLEDILKNMNFSHVDVNYKEIRISAKDSKQIFALSLQEWGEKAIQAGVTTSQELDLWRSTIHHISEDDPSFCTVVRQAYAIAWKR